MSAYKTKTLTLEKENLQYCLVKIKFAVCKIFRQILHKDTNNNGSNNHNNTMSQHQENQRIMEGDSLEDSRMKFSNEIEQNLANERLVKTWLQQPYVLAI